MKLLIAGDLALQDRARRTSWDETVLNHSFSEVRNLASSCDYSIVNLESPVTEKTKAIEKDGPALKSPPSVFEIIKYCGFSVVTLANNHIKDFGCSGVVDTINHCNSEYIQFVGAGRNLSEARNPLILSDNSDFRIGIINVCEHESSIASNNTPGANPYDLVNLFYDIKQLKEQVNRVIIIIHGGREHYQLPTPRMKREYHLLVDYGADVIVNHHQHCYSGYEIYAGKPIFYGLGNFFFDNPRKRQDKWNKGLLLTLDFENNDFHFELTPFTQCDEEVGIKLKHVDSIARFITELNSIIGSNQLLEAEFKKQVLLSRPLWPFLFFSSRPMRTLYYHKLMPAFLSNKKKIEIENAIRCETHREVLINFFDINNDNT